MKNKKHDKIINDFDNQKKKHLEKQASKLLKKDNINKKLKNNKIKGDFLKLW